MSALRLMRAARAFRCHAARLDYYAQRLRARAIYAYAFVDALLMFIVDITCLLLLYDDIRARDARVPRRARDTIYGVYRARVTI